MSAFEFDEQESSVNLKEHGISFVDAQKLWEDPDLVEIPSKTSNEPRL